jgi:hypothetical protein
MMMMTNNIVQIHLVVKVVSLIEFGEGTDQYRQIVQLNLPREYEFLRDEVLLKAYHRSPGCTVRVLASALFDQFVAYLGKESAASKYPTSMKMFGVRLTALCDGKSEALAGCSKKAMADGQNYTYDVDVVCRAMVGRMWLDEDMLVRADP